MMPFYESDTESLTALTCVPASGHAKNCDFVDNMLVNSRYIPWFRCKYKACYSSKSEDDNGMDIERTPDKGLNVVPSNVCTDIKENEERKRKST
jgi:hypothetical protein